jgi:hypothetical protein
MKFVTSFTLSGNGTDFREFGYTGSSDDISGYWIAVTVRVSRARHNIFFFVFLFRVTCEFCLKYVSSFLSVIAVDFNRICVWSV